MRLKLASFGTALLGIASLFVPPMAVRLPAQEAMAHFHWYGLWLSYLRLFALPLCLVALSFRGGKPVVWMQLVWGLGFALVSIMALTEMGPANSELPWLMFVCFIFGLSVVVSALPLLKSNDEKKVPES